MKLFTDEANDYRDKMIVDAHICGTKQVKIAEMYGVNQSTVSRTLKKYRANGCQLPLPHATTASSRPALSTGDESLLKEVLSKSSIAEGYESDFWDRRRIKEVVEKRFGVRYDISHISRIAKRLGLTLQKPKRADYRGDDGQKAKWVEERLPALKKSP